MKKTIDLRGLTCPEPVLRTKKLIDDSSISSIEALVDSEVNVQNLCRLASSSKLMVSKEKQADHFRVVIVRSVDAGADKSNSKSSADSGSGAGENSPHAHVLPAKTGAKSETAGTAADVAHLSTGTIILISRDTFGQGANMSAGENPDHDFSANLLNLFLQTVNQSGHKPRAILMVNSGVKVIDPDGPYIKVLNDLREGGTEVLACGLCLDYYKLKEKVAVEQITNMFAICEYLFAADRIISP